MVNQTNGSLPDYVVVTEQQGRRLTPNEIRALKAETGRTLEELFGEKSDEAEKMQTLAWLALRRQGFQVRWDDCGDIAVEPRAEVPDPTSGEPSASSPVSAGSGASPPARSTS